MVMTPAPVTSTASRFTVVKPGSVIVTAVGAGQQLGEAVAARAIADRRADLLDQDRAGGLDGDARQNCAGGVANRAGDRRLSVGQRWQQGHQRHDGKTANEH